MVWKNLNSQLPLQPKKRKQTQLRKHEADNTRKNQQRYSKKRTLSKTSRMTQAKMHRIRTHRLKQKQEDKFVTFEIYQSNWKKKQVEKQGYFII